MNMRIHLGFRQKLSSCEYEDWKCEYILLDQHFMSRNLWKVKGDNYFVLWHFLSIEKVYNHNQQVYF